VRYVFEEYCLDTNRRELRRGDYLVPIEPQVFDLLEQLVGNNDRLVTKDDLIASVWQGRIVSESALTTRLNAARTAIGDNGKQQRLIKTVPRKGFRFVGKVREEDQPFEVTDTSGQVGPSTHRERAALTVPDRPSIVVLPFVNLSGDPDQEYFADGMVEDITIALGRLPWLFVIGSASAFTYKGRAVDVRQIGSELGVRYALKGSVRKESNRVRITCHLAETSHGRQVWADRFEDELDGIFAMQDRVAEHVGTVIAPALRAEEIERARRKTTESLTAYDLLLRAFALHRVGYAQNEEALRLLAKAVALDPSYGAAYGLAAWCYDLQKIFGWVPPSDPRLNEGIRLARIASDVGSNDSEALWMTAHALTLLAGETQLALVLMKKAISLNPNSPNAWWVSGTAHYFSDYTAIALEHGARARRLSPVDPMAYNHWLSTAMAHFFAGQYQDAADAADKSLGEHVNFPPALRLKVAISGLLGRIEEGHQWVARLLAVNPDASVAKLKVFYEPLLRINPKRLETYLKGLRLGGLPEG
jgi:TolB-like protein/tetratricopeptide (TPR) repeat protein